MRWTGNLLSVELLLKISENLLESKPFKTSLKLHYFEKNLLCACSIYMRVPNLHTTPKEHLIKIRTFLQKNDSY